MKHISLGRLLTESRHFTVGHFKVFLMIMALPVLISLIGFGLIEQLITLAFGNVKKHITFWLVLDLLAHAIVWNFIACMVYANWVEHTLHRQLTVIWIPFGKRSFIFLKYSLLFSIPESVLILGCYIALIFGHVISPPSEPIISYLAHQSLRQKWMLGGFLSAIPYYYVMARLSFVFAVTSLDARTTLVSAWKKMTPDHVLVFKISLILSAASVILDQVLLYIPGFSGWLYGQHALHTLLETLTFGIMIITCVKLYERDVHRK